MNDLANRLQSPGRRSRNTLPTAIFGSAGRLGQMIEVNKPPVRIGLWPIISDSAPEFAMGLATILALLLDRYPNVRTYRIFAQLDGEPENYQWSIEKSQFDVDDWEIEGLDENAAVWGSLSQQGDSWQLKIEVENDLIDEDIVKEFTYDSTALSGFIKLMPDITKDIADYLSGGEIAITSSLYEQPAAEDDVTQLLATAFRHELALLLSLWGEERSLAAIQDDIQKLVTEGQGSGDFGAWLASSAVARDLLYSDNLTDDAFVPIGGNIIEAFAESSIPAIILSQALFNSEQIQPAYDLLEANIENHPESVNSYLTLAELYRSGGRAEDAINTFQTAIDNEVTHANLYLRYAAFLQVLDFNNISINEYALVDPTQHEEPLLWESISAYEEAMEIDSDNLEAMAALLIQLSEVAESDEDTEQLWQGFEKLVRLDESGDYVRQVVDALYNHDMLDIESGIATFKQQITLTPQRYDLHLNLAVLYLVIEESADAERELRQAMTLTNNPDALLDIKRLLLNAEDPDFEMRIGELSDIVNAGNQLNTDDVEYLEETLEHAPGMSDIYLLIARAYLGWNEQSSAIETLLDAHKNLPDDADVTVLLAQTLWDAGEHELAFTYLNKGIVHSPNHVPLLSVLGQYLFEDGQEEPAKAYLARAERISPRDPVLAKVKFNIARMFGEQ